MEALQTHARRFGQLLLAERAERAWFARRKGMTTLLFYEASNGIPHPEPALGPDGRGFV
jgi:hypothetical protein